MLLVDRPRREGVTDAAAYIVGGSLATAVLAAGVGVFIRGLSSPRELLDWYFWPTWAAGFAVYDVGGVTGSVLRSIKAQLTAVAYGTHVLLDLAREPSVRADGPSRWFGESRSSRTASWSHCWSASGGPGGWSGSAFSCRSPASTEYYMVSLPPLLLLLGPIAARPPGSAPGVRPFLTGSVAVLLVALVVVNVWAAILPWRAYGQMKQGLTARFQPEVQAGDLFVSSESGIDTIFRGNPRHVGVKEVLKQKGRGLSDRRCADPGPAGPRGPCLPLQLQPHAQSVHVAQDQHGGAEPRSRSRHP
jgi:hypothetical protein